MICAVQMTAVEPAGLRVGLCGRSARVELRPDEGLSELRARVADAFGITAPFDLINPQGVPMRSDTDTSLSLAGVTFPEVTVDAGEDILLDLERAHEETGAIRWVMLRKIIAGVRRQVAEAHAGIADAQHRSAVLDEQLVLERSSREAADAATCKDLRGLVQRLEEESNRSRREASSALEAAVAELKGSFEDSLGRLELKLKLEADSLKQEMGAEKEGRIKLDDEAAEHCQQAHAAVQHETEVRAQELQEVRKEMAALQEQLARGEAARERFQDKVGMETAELGVRLTEEQTLREHDLVALKALVEEAHEKLAQEGVKIEDKMVTVGRQIQEATAAAEEQLLVHEAATLHKLDNLAALEGTIEKLTSQERSTREAELGSMASKLEEWIIKSESHTAEREHLEERLQKGIDEAVAHAESGRSALEQKTDSYEERFVSAQLQLRVEERSRVDDIEAVRNNCDSLSEAIEKWRKQNEVDCTAISSAETTKREDDMEEVRRMHTAHSEEQRAWAHMLIEQLTKDLRSEHEANASELRRRGEEVSHEAAQRVKMEIMPEVNRVEAEFKELGRARDAALIEDRMRREAEAEHTGSEVRDCLTAHTDFMEALEHEQRILINRLNEGLAQEDQKSDGLGQRIQGVELDMQKVRGHLPILFAGPTAFR